METVSLTKFQHFRGADALSALNKLVETHSNLMAHQVAAATGCDLYTAMALLLHLSALAVVRPKTLVYHRNDDTDPPTPILSLEINVGPPTLPFICPICNQLIDDYDELNFDFIFILDKKIRFED
jgi:hypothetical protein